MTPFFVMMQTIVILAMWIMGVGFGSCISTQNSPWIVLFLLGLFAITVGYFISLEKQFSK